MCLATVLVGGDKPSQIYVRMKQTQGRRGRDGAPPRRAARVGSQTDVEYAGQELVDDPDVHGILVQLPLPDGLDPERVLL